MERARLELTSGSEEDTDAIGRALGAVLRDGDVLALDGELGAGKTRLVRGLAAGMGIDPARVCSPTFVIVHEYVSDGARVGGLRHVDAYRLGGGAELETVGWDRVTDGGAPVVIEWAARIADALPGDAGRVAIEVTGLSSRRLVLDAPASWALRREWAALAAGARGGGARLATTCPACGRAVEPGNPSWPFSSERCRMADLGSWLTGRYSIAGEAAPGDDEGGGAPSG